MKMKIVAPNLGTLIGDTVAARLISHAGSLTNLAKCPASTVQILGAEKALFRALKTRGNTPKYGLIFHSSFIGRAGAKNKSRISRYLANKCSIASRIDCFAENATTIFGSKMKDQVEERLKFYETGDLPRKNVDVMAEALEEAADEAKSAKKSEKKKKRKLENGDAESANTTAETSQIEEAEDPAKKKKKKKNKENGDVSMNGNTTAETSQLEEESGEKKKKKKKKNKDEEAETEVTADSTMDTSQVEDAETSVKKKKKKKDKEAVEAPPTPVAETNGHTNGDAATSSKKKKKKNKE